MVLGNVTQYVFNNAYVQQIPALVQKDLFLNLFNLFIYVIGIVLYAVVIWFFYRNLAKKELFKVAWKPSAHGIFAFLTAITDFIQFLIRSLIVFPLISFLWFVILGAFLLFLSKSNDVAQILLMALSVIAAARITAYFNEDLSKDVAKLIPFGLLGVFIVDPNYFSLDATLQKFVSLPANIHIILQYLIAIILLELILRTISRLWEKANEPEDDKPVQQDIDRAPDS